jgi:polyketide cyclase/dehydrase/lipid transport protein/SnoaL-like protein
VPTGIVNRVNTGSDPEEFVTKFADFWSSPSPQRLTELLHPDVVLVQPLAAPMRGIEAAQAEFQRFCSCLPGLCAQVDRWCGDGNLVFIEFRLQARIGGAVTEWPNVNRILLRDGKAIERATYFDPLAILPTLLRHPSVWWRWWRSGRDGSRPKSMNPMRRSARIYIDSPPEAVWPLIGDVTKIGWFSPETFEAQWLDGATGPAVGAKFRGHVKRNQKGPVYWTTCTVTECQPERVFAFAVRSRPFGLPIAPHDTVQLTWRYQLDPSADGGTDVTESFELEDIPAMRLYWRALGWVRGPRMKRDMERTLHAIKTVVEQ